MCTLVIRQQTEHIETGNNMSGDNLALYVAAYSDATSAKADFKDLKHAEGNDLKVEAVVEGSGWCCRG
jgi:hypothetical protein